MMWGEIRIFQNILSFQNFITAWKIIWHGQKNRLIMGKWNLDEEENYLLSVNFLLDNKQKTGYI